LLDLTGLDNLTSIGNDLVVQGCDSLVDLGALSSLEWVDSVLVDECPSMAHLGDLPGLASIGGNLSIGEPFDGMPALEDVDGLAWLTAVGGVLEIWHSPALLDLAGLSSVTSVGSNLHVYDCDSLTDLDGLYGIESLGGSLLEIGYNAALPACEATAFHEHLVALGWEGTAALVMNEGDGGCE
jgi:hypothetical protein